MASVPNDLIPDVIFICSCELLGTSWTGDAEGDADDRDDVEAAADGENVDKLRDGREDLKVARGKKNPGTAGVCDLSFED